VAVQSYTDASLYTEKDLAILEFVSDSIAIAIAHMRADNALENSEEKYRLLFEETPVGILTCDINGIIQSINNTALQLLGSPSEEATKQINLLTFPPLKEIGFSDDLKHCMNEGREISSEKLYTSKWGKSVFFHYKIIPTLNQEGKITGALCTLEDITEQKRAEEIQSTIYKISDAINTTATLDELYQTIHQHLSTVIDTTNFYIALYDEEKEFISFPYFVDEKDSQPAPRKLRKGLTEYVMRTDKAIFVTEESLYKLEEKGEVELLGSSSALWLGIPLRIEKKIIGVMTVQSYTDSSLYNEKDLAILEFVSDQVAIAIDRKKKGEQIKKDLEEKIVMLMEIHHRVKNNMQVISSMLKMQSGYIRDEQDRQLFKDSLNRVKSMALIHEKLYQTEDLANIDFSEYINSLAMHLFSTFGIDKFDIQLDTKVRDVSLDINTAIPCGLIINELISNSLKYAFPHGEKGKITVNFIWKEDTEFHDGKIYTLVVKDNGVGFPADIDFRNTESLGLQLVNTLVEQLHGNIKLNGEEGTSFEIIFKRVKLKKRSRFYR
ncbi:MAG: GAF domain-containing protein, partial [Candidatus Cloacimonetes bacterium]|nr:GAF domain-containing protein [Candidatus Cloacimonadota bacterium]